jgi:opacity protein-like surface antigen
MKKIMISLFAIASSSLAFAGSFEGAYVGGGIGAQYAENKNLNGDSGNLTNEKMSDTHFLGQVTAGYGIDLTQDFNLTTNVFFNLSNDKTGSTSGVTGKTKNNIGFSIEPGYYLNKDTLAYVKLGYARLDSKLDSSVSGTTSNTTLDGFVWGAGAKYHIDKNLFVGAEVVEYNYGNNSVTLGGTSTTYKTNQTTGLINVGYQF